MSEKNKMFKTIFIYIEASNDRFIFAIREPLLMLKILAKPKFRSSADTPQD